MMCPTKRLRAALAPVAVGDAVVRLTSEASGTVLLRGHFTSLIPFDRSSPRSLCFKGGADRQSAQMLRERFCAVMVRNWTGALLTSTSISPRR